MYRFLLIDDCDSDASSFKDSITRLNSGSPEKKYELEVAPTYKEAFDAIYNNLNGIIVDINLDSEQSGLDLVDEITKKFRVPVAIFTGTPGFECDRQIKVFIKGAATHDEIINYLCGMYDTGLFNVLGRTGMLETIMAKIFWNNLYPHMNIWESKEGGEKTEKMILRYAVSLIEEFIDNDLPLYATEEMYACPPVDPNLKTGCIIQSKDNNSCYIVLSPPCDLAIHEGNVKTDSVLLCEIEDEKIVHSSILENVKKSDAKNKVILNAIKNNHKDYYHWLPGNGFFKGGYINFRKVSTHSISDLKERFNDPALKIQKGFVKNILNRFSFYYSRQGQPDFDFAEEARRILEDFS